MMLGKLEARETVLGTLEVTATPKECMPVKEVSTLLGIPSGFIYKATDCRYTADDKLLDYEYMGGNGVISIPVSEFDRLIELYASRRKPRAKKCKVEEAFNAYCKLDDEGKAMFNSLLENNL